MANKKANEKRVFMRVPASFNIQVMTLARERHVKAAVMLESCGIIYREPQERADDICYKGDLK